MIKPTACEPKPSHSPGWLILLAALAFPVVASPLAAAQTAPQPAAPAGPSTPASHAKGDISGDWQGTYRSADGSAREVLRITRLPDGEWQTVLYQIDHNGLPSFAPFTTLQGSDFTFECPPARISFKGRLSPDGNMLSGTWTQAQNPSAKIDFVRATKETAWEIPSMPAQPKRMADNADPSFAVATIKPSDPNNQQPQFGSGMNYRSNGRTFTESNATLAEIIEWAYRIHAKQLDGGPDWIQKDRYDITGLPDAEGAPNDQQLRTMMQKLLADRFQLAIHHDTRELPVYVLSIANPPTKTLTKSAAGEMGMQMTKVQPGKITVTCNNVTLSAFVHADLERFLTDRPILDQTSLTDHYDLSLVFAPAAGSHEAQFGGPAKDDDIPASDIFTAVQRQLGLKLQPTRAPVDVLIIDKIELPSAN